jgi:PAS domain-containing protein
VDGTGGLDADATPVGRPLGKASFRALVERSRDLFAVTDRAGRYVYASPSHAQVVGWTPEELFGRDGTALIHPDDAARVTAVLGGQIASGFEPPLLEVGIAVGKSRLPASRMIGKTMRRVETPNKIATVSNWARAVGQQLATKP